MLNECTDIALPPQEYIDLVGGGTPEQYRMFSAELCSLVCKHGGARPDDRVLDIGCGCGRVAASLTSYLTNGSYDGFDVVLPMIEWCRENISSRYPNFRFHHADLTNTLYSKVGLDASNYTFPFTDNSFDFVYATSLFTHLVPKTAARYAQEIARVLGDGGAGLLTFYLIDPTRPLRRADAPNFAHKMERYVLANLEIPEAAIAFEDQFAVEILQSAGLDVDSISYGLWCDSGGWTFQDVILVSKPRTRNVFARGARKLCNAILRRKSSL